MVHSLRKFQGRPHFSLPSSDYVGAETEEIELCAKGQLLHPWNRQEWYKITPHFD